MKKILFLFLTLQMHLSAIGQQVLSAASGGGAAGTMQLDYTLGEMVAVQTVQTATTIVTQGYHQPYRLLVSVVEALSPDVLQIFPNPTALHLTLSSDAESARNMRLRLLDNLGRICMEQAWQLSAGQNALQITLLDQPTGVYYLQCMDTATQQMGSWKIVKTQD